MNQIQLWEFILQKLKVKQPVVLLCVVQSKGSSPGRAQFKMAVTIDDMNGSIGGGVMEHKMVELAKKKLQDPNFIFLVKKQIHNKAASKNQSGMICSGEQTNLLFALNQGHISTMKSIVKAIKGNKKGAVKIMNEDISFIKKTDKLNQFSYTKTSGNNFEYIENISQKNVLYIIGGGHCSLALSKIMATLNFDVFLIEERENLNTFLQNNFTQNKLQVSNYKQIDEVIPSGNNHYVVVMTMGYRTDEIALKSLLKNEYKYLGVLGSEAKMKQLISSLINDGFDKQKLNKIYTPIGLKIKSETPEEIAISIAAEIIEVKNKV